MWRFLAGVVSALLLAGAGLFWWQGRDGATLGGLPRAPFAAMAQGGATPLADPPEASDRTREEKRFARYDKDRNGAVAREEYLAARRKAFARLDTDGDGRLAFEEYAVKTTAKFAAADKDRSGVLSAVEFAATRVVRKAAVRPRCPPAKEGGEEEG